MNAWAAHLLPVAAVALSLGCTALQPPLTSPARGGAPWTEVTSQHFVVWTDLDRDEGQRALGEFEGIYRALEDLAFPSSAEQPRVNVVLFAREKDYLQFAPEATTALFVPALPNDLDEVPTLLMYGELVDQTRLTFQHELTHLFIRQSLGWAPPWLHEGLAEYYSTLRVDDGLAYLGEPLPHRGVSMSSDWRSTRLGPWNRQIIPLRDLPTVRRLISADAETFYAWVHGGATPDGARQLQAAFYCGSWGLAHLLLNGPPAYQQRLRRYLDALAHGKRADRAWRDAFGDVPPRALEDAYRAHMRWTEKMATVHRTRYDPPPRARPRMRPMAASEVHLLWVRLRPWLAPNLGDVRADLDSAAAYAPGSPEVRFWNGRFLTSEGRLADAERELSAAVAARADSPLFLFGLAKLHAASLAESDAEAQAPSPLARLAETVARLSKVATAANALDFVAAFHAEHGAPQDGIAFGARAVKADPTCYRCLDTYARLLFLKGDLDEAVSVEERALTLVPTHAPEPDMAARLRLYRAAQAATGRALTR